MTDLPPMDSPANSSRSALMERWYNLHIGVRIAVVVVAVVVAFFVVRDVIPTLIGTLGGLAFVALFIVPYFIPSIIAIKRDHASKGGIIALNVLAGWTLAGWIIALIWSLANPGSAAGPTVVVNTTQVAGAPPPPQYRVGDVVNGHRFDGTRWVPVDDQPPAPQS